MPVASPRHIVRTLIDLPPTQIPPGYVLDLSGRGRTYVTDVAGPPGAPTVLLLHAVGCTGMLTWFRTIEALSTRYRVVTFDQRWHGRGITSEHFSLQDCADDVAAVVEALGLEDVVVAGYSMGSIVAQRVWRQHPDLVRGLVLCATTDRFRASVSERAFHHSMEVVMTTLRGLSRSRMVRMAARNTVDVLDLGRTDLHDWALAEFRSTSPWAVAQAVAALGRHHSRPWLRQIDVPVAVVVTRKDRVIAAERQRELARRIPGATVHEVDAGHASCVLQSDKFVPALLEAFACTFARARDLAA